MRTLLAGRTRQTVSRSEEGEGASGRVERSLGGCVEVEGTG